MSFCHNITVTIPTRKRPKLLDNCIASIFLGGHEKVNVVVGCCYREQDLPKAGASHHIHIYEMPEMSVVGFQNFMIGKLATGFALPISDDVQFEKGAIGRAYRYLLKHFPDTDGVVGMNQANVPGGTDTSFMLMGTKFLDRFDRRRPFHPEYRHFFADTEVGEYAKREGKFKFCKAAKLVHFHPSASVEYPKDDTHEHARRVWAFDKAVYDNRTDRKK